MLESAMPRAELVLAEDGDLSAGPGRVADFVAHVAATGD
jgi:hypothetical protein